MTDAVGGQLLSAAFFAQPAGGFRVLTYTLEEMTDEVVVLGDSRAVHHYDSGLIASRTGMTVHNAGSGGRDILYMHAVYLAITERYTPKVIVLNLGADMVERAAIGPERLAPLVPYSQRHPQLGDTIRLRSRWELQKLWSNLYRYNSVLLAVAGSHFLPRRALDGFQPLIPGELPAWVVPGQEPGETPERAEETARLVVGNSPESTDLDMGKIARLKMLLSDARGRGIRVVCVVSPVFRPTPDGARANAVALAAAGVTAQEVELWDFYADSSFADEPELFIDAIHMSAKGARRFTEMVAERLGSS